MCKETMRVYCDGCAEGVLHYRLEVAYSENACKCYRVVTKEVFFF